MRSVDDDEASGRDGALAAVQVPVAMDGEVDARWRIRRTGAVLG